MNSPFIARELTVVARRGALVSAVALYIALLAAFTLTWGFALPLLTGRTAYEALRVVQWAALTIVMPWIAARCCAADRGNELVMLSALAVRRPSAIVAAKIIAIAVVLVVVACAGLPSGIVAQQMSAVPVWVVLRDFGSSVTLALLASAVTMGWVIAVDDVVRAWAGASATMGTVVAAMSWMSVPQLARDVALIVVAAAFAGAVAAWSNRAFQYCDE